jgi:thiol-disulfide isomerase/thioredoxin
MKWKWVSGMVMLLGAAPLAAAAQTLAVGQRAPVVTVPDLEGHDVAVGVTGDGHPAVIEFWATWCEICKALMPRMVAAHKAYGDRVDFFGVNVTVNDPESHVRRFVAKEHPPYRTVYDARGRAVRAFGAMTTSYVVIVDAHDTVRYIGTGSSQDISGQLARVLQP